MGIVFDLALQMTLGRVTATPGANKVDVTQAKAADTTDIAATASTPPTIDATPTAAARRARWRLLPNKSIGLNILAIASGVAFLAFALAIYDGYRRKVETIIFSLTPHIMLRPGVPLSSNDAPSLAENAACLKVCRAPFAVYFSEQSEAARSTGRFDPAKVKSIGDWVKAAAPPGTTASRVLFEEAKLELNAGTYSSGGLRQMRLLGLDSLHGDKPAPRIDLTFSGRAVGDRFRQGNGILISDALADEIERDGGPRIIPGVTNMRIGIPGRLRDYPVVGIHSLGIHAISRNLIIAPYQVAADLMNDDGTAGPSYVGLTLSDASEAKAVAATVRTALRRDEIAAIGWQSVTDLFDQLELYRWIIIVTLTLSVLVTAINTFVNVNILIMERAQQIGIMRAMGLSPVQLQSVFTLIGIFQSVVGTIVGYATGILVGYLLDDYINSLVRDFVPITHAGIAPDVHVMLGLLGAVTVVSVAACLLAGRRALKSDIVANLRSM